MIKQAELEICYAQGVQAAFTKIAEEAPDWFKERLRQVEERSNLTGDEYKKKYHEDAGGYLRPALVGGALGGLTGVGVGSIAGALSTPGGKLRKLLGALRQGAQTGGTMSLLGGGFGAYAKGVDNFRVNRMDEEGIANQKKRDAELMDRAAQYMRVNR